MILHILDFRIPPAITVTDHDDSARTTTVDDDSDADTSPSSDEDDYPDQVALIFQLRNSHHHFRYPEFIFLMVY